MTFLLRAVPPTLFRSIHKTLRKTESVTAKAEQGAYGLQSPLALVELAPWTAGLGLRYRHRVSTDEGVYRGAMNGSEADDHGGYSELVILLVFDYLCSASYVRDFGDT